MKPDQAAKVLRRYQAWRTDKNIPPTETMPPIFEITAAIDAAVAALELSARPVAEVIPDVVGTEVAWLPGMKQPVGTKLFAGPQPAFCCCKCGMPDLKAPAAGGEQAGP